ncbi:hypothetical protein RchiOBHm_Chr1g0322981 [Rosa chinensis]|uniref:Secreted protein n=1 Tax=Rosa chinensis TaxID=74649 RepID=A0A2P6S9D4_ROSCH|nr:hypothetical protein RchiOBHm_Chr1g0322981 [Rosa chinensis]
MLVLICLPIFLCLCNNHLILGAPIYHIKRHNIHFRLLYFISLFTTKHFCWSFCLNSGPCSISFLKHGLS